MDWWVIRQLRAMVLSDLRGLFPAGYFSASNSNYSVQLENGAFFARELSWAEQAGRLGRNLLFEPPEDISPRQVAAADLLLNLGLLVAYETMQSMTQCLSEKAQALGTFDGDAGLVSNQLKRTHIPTGKKNVLGALTQYLRYLSATEASPFLHLLPQTEVNAIPEELPREARQLFEHLCARNFASAWLEFSSRQRDFERRETQRGGLPGGTGFAARLELLYAAELDDRAKTIAETLKQVFSGLRLAPTPLIASELSDIGTKALAAQHEGLKGAIARYLESIGESTLETRQLDLKYAANNAMICNSIREVLN